MSNTVNGVNVVNKISWKHDQKGYKDAIDKLKQYKRLKASVSKPTKPAREAKQNAGKAKQIKRETDARKKQTMVERTYLDTEKALRKVTGLNATQTKKYGDQLDKLSNDYIEGRVSAQRYRSELGRISDEYKAIGKAAKLSAKEQIKAQKAATKAAEKAADKRKERKAAIVSGVKTAAVAGVTAVAGGTAMAVKSSTDRAMELQKNANLSGISVEEFQKLSEGYKKLGFDASAAADHQKNILDLMGDYNREMKLTGKGAGALVDLQESLEIPKETVNSWKTTNDVLTTVFNNPLFKSDLKKQKFVLEALGSDLAGLAPLYENQGKMLREVGDEAERLNIITSAADNTKLVETAQGIVTLESQWDKAVDNFSSGVLGLNGDSEKTKESMATLKTTMQNVGEVATVAGNGLNDLFNVISSGVEAMKYIDKLTTFGKDDKGEGGVSVSDTLSNNPMVNPVGFLSNLIDAGKQISMPTLPSTLPSTPRPTQSYRDTMGSSGYGYGRSLQQPQQAYQYQQQQPMGKQPPQQIKIEPLNIVVTSDSEHFNATMENVAEATIVRHQNSVYD